MSTPIWNKTQDGNWFASTVDCGQCIAITRVDHLDTKAWRLEMLADDGWLNFGNFIAVNEAKQQACKLLGFVASKIAQASECNMEGGMITDQPSFND